MATTKTALVRMFTANGVELPDPDPAISPQAAVRLIALAGRPDLATAEIRGPQQEGEKLVYTLHRAVGTKGQRAAKRLAGFIVAADNHRVDTDLVPALESLRLNKGHDCLALPSASLPWLG